MKGGQKASVGMQVTNPTALNNAVSLARVEPPSILSLIEKVIDNPNASVEVLRGMFELQKDFQKQQAEIAFNEAMARLQPKLPTITKHGKISYGAGKKDIAFARYEDIMLAIRGPLSEEGFSLSFDQPEKEEHIGFLSHKAGHKISAKFFCAPDNSGGKNAIQAQGSARQYARRNIIVSLLNIITIGEDDDAATFSYITPVQADQLRARIEQEKIDERKMLDSVGADSVEHIHASRFKEVVRKIDERRSILAKKNEVQI